MTVSNPKTIDVFVRNEGTIWLLYPRTVAAEAWIEHNVDPEARWVGHALVVEHRYGPDIVAGLVADGLEVSA